MLNASAKTTFKTIAVTTALLLGMVIAILPWQAQAGRYELAQDNPAEGLSGVVSNRDACTAFLNNLKEFENQPYGMACRRELDPKLGFTRPTWEKLDILTHIPLTFAIMKFANLEATWLPNDPKLWEARIKVMVEKENLTLDLIRIDLKGDGKLMNLVRFGFGWPCDPKLEIDMSPDVWNKHRRLFVADQTLTKVDPYSDKASFHAVIDDVFTYKGKVFTDRFWPEPPSVRGRSGFTGKLSLIHFSQYGPVDVCTFVYKNTTNMQRGKQP